MTQVIVEFTENIAPAFTAQDKADYYKFVNKDQILPVGSQVNGRQLIVTVTSDLDGLVAFLNERGKEVTICDVRYRLGMRYGFRDVKIGEDENGYGIFEPQIILDENGSSHEYPRNDSEYQLHMQPRNGIDIDNNPVLIDAVGATIAGWKSWSERI